MYTVELYVGYNDNTWDIKTVNIISRIDGNNSDVMKTLATTKFTDTLTEKEKENIAFIGIYSVAEKEED